jgi:hypothetical protein
MFAAKDRSLQDAAASSRPGTLAAPARFLPTSDRSSPNCTCPREPGRRRVSGLRTLLPAQRFQHLYFHALPHSLQQEQKLTPALSIASALFLRSFAQERKSTPLFSCACARFCRNRGAAKKRNQSESDHPTTGGRPERSRGTSPSLCTARRRSCGC